MNAIRTILAPNPSPMTLDGTRTYLVGQRQVAIIDPGPMQAQHINAVVDEVGSGVIAAVLLTHDHPDHSEAAHELAGRLNVAVAAVTDGSIIETDAGALRALATPGHTPDHFAYHLSEQDAIFCGDLMMGGMDTALVALPEGDLRAYLASLEKLRTLRPRIIYPAHGEPFEEPERAIDQYVQHRRDRVQQVEQALRARPATADQLIDEIYGTALDERLRVYAREAIEAYLAFLKAEQRVQQTAAGEWRVS